MESMQNRRSVFTRPSRSQQKAHFGEQHTVGAARLYSADAAEAAGTGGAHDLEGSRPRGLDTPRLGTPDSRSRPFQIQRRDAWDRRWYLEATMGTRRKSFKPREVSSALPCAHRARPRY